MLRSYLMGLSSKAVIVLVPNALLSLACIYGACAECFAQPCSASSWLVYMVQSTMSHMHKLMQLQARSHDVANGNHLHCKAVLAKSDTVGSSKLCFEKKHMF